MRRRRRRPRRPPRHSREAAVSGGWPGDPQARGDADQCSAGARSRCAGRRSTAAAPDPQLPPTPTGIVASIQGRLVTLLANLLNKDVTTPDARCAAGEENHLSGRRCRTPSPAGRSHCARARGAEHVNQTCAKTVMTSRLPRSSSSEIPLFRDMPEGPLKNLAGVVHPLVAVRARDPREGEYAMARTTRRAGRSSLQLDGIGPNRGDRERHWTAACRRRSAAGSRHQSVARCPRGAAGDPNGSQARGTRESKRARFLARAVPLALSSPPTSSPWQTPGPLILTPALRKMLKRKELKEFKQLFDDRYRQRTLRALCARRSFKGLSER